MNKIEAIDWQKGRVDDEIADLENRLRQAHKTLRRLNEAREHALSDTLVSVVEPARCSGCGADVSTERLFSEHFVIPDPRYYNLGHCPNKD